MTAEEYRAAQESMHPRLRRLLEACELNWDDYWHRCAFMRFWLGLPRRQGDE